MVMSGHGDVQRITGKSYSYSCGLIKKIREALGKKDHQAITLEEFSRYLGLPENEVRGKLA